VKGMDFDTQTLSRSPSCIQTRAKPQVTASWIPACLKSLVLASTADAGNRQQPSRRPFPFGASACRVDPLRRFCAGLMFRHGHDEFYTRITHGTQCRASSRAHGYVMSLMTTGYLGLIAAFYCRAPLQFALRLLTGWRCPDTVVHDAGGADTHAQRAILGSEPCQGGSTLPFPPA